MGHSISDGPDKLGDSSSWQYRSSIFPLNVQETKPRIPTYTVTNLQLQNRTTQTANAGTYLQTPLRLPELFPIGLWNRFK